MTVDEETMLVINAGIMNARAPKNIRWVPQPDITAHELSLALIPLLQGFRHPGFDVEDTIANLPEGARRHFEVT